MSFGMDTENFIVYIKAKGIPSGTTKIWYLKLGIR